MAVFQYDTDILTRYPTVVGGVILAQGMTNGPAPEELQAAFLACFPQFWRGANSVP